MNAVSGCVNQKKIQFPIASFGSLGPEDPSQRREPVDRHRGLGK